MKGTVDGIHALGMKAGTYSDAGANTCGSEGGDKSGLGAGLYGHDAADCKLHFNELGFDFILARMGGGGGRAGARPSRAALLREGRAPLLFASRTAFGRGIPCAAVMGRADAQERVPPAWPFYGRAALPRGRKGEGGRDGARPSRVALLREGHATSWP